MSENLATKCERVDLSPKKKVSQKFFLKPFSGKFEFDGF
jgi:hypothetical protein